MQLQRAMAKEAEAARDARAKVGGEEGRREEGGKLHPACFDFLLTVPIHVNGFLIRKLSQHLKSRENSALENTFK